MLPVRSSKNVVVVELRLSMFDVLNQETRYPCTKNRQQAT